jgi:uncharacterized glyoxalase superfamily protein PhnB
MPPKPRPEGYHSVTPYLVVPRVKELIPFLKRAFGAVERFPPMTRDDGTIAHAELQLGDSVVMMGEASAEWPPMPSTLHVYADEEVDAVYRRAVEAGATSVREPADQFYGDRSATVRDPSGNLWSIANHVEDVSPEEMERRIAREKEKQRG